MEVLVLLPDTDWPERSLKAFVQAARARFVRRRIDSVCFAARPDVAARCAGWWPTLEVLDKEKEYVTPLYDLCIHLEGSKQSLELQLGVGNRLDIVLGANFPDENDLLRATRRYADSLPPAQAEVFETVLHRPGADISALFFLQDVPKNAAVLKRLTDWGQDYLRKQGVTEVRLAIPEAEIREYAKLAPCLEAIAIEKAVSDPSFEIWLLINNQSFECDFRVLTLPGNPFDHVGKRLYGMVRSGHTKALKLQTEPIRTLSEQSKTSIAVTIHERSAPHVNANIFTRMANHADCGGLYFIPVHYYILNDNGFGDTNEFGFRTARDLDWLQSRPSNHKVIAVFGGSSVYSIDCLPDETFCAVLERKLNALYQRNGGGLTFAVLNFGMPGATTMHQIITYLLHCHKIMPDLILTSDGYNDLFWGLRSDPCLLNELALTYPVFSEHWTQAALSAKSVPPTFQPNRLADGMQFRNGPHAVVSAYLTRKNQFMHIARNGGAKFIWGVQPVSHCKETADERRSAESRRRNGTSNMTTDETGIPFLYDLLLSHPPADDGAHYVDAHSHFASLSETRDDLFTDTVHLTPLGDEKLADLFLANIIRMNIFEETSAAM